MILRATGAAALVFMLAAGDSAGMTIWTGPTVTFVKVPFEDHTNPISQDRLTDNVWLTRANTMGLFNIKTESAYSRPAGSPADTEWAFGTTADLGALTFADWTTWHGGDPPGSVGRDAVLHLITDDIFLDIKFIGWSVGGAGGGGFGYERSSPEPPQPGDTNGDGLVNIDDLNAVRNNFGQMGPDDGTLQGDTFPFDGNVDIDDLNAVRNNFGAGAAAVPEPAGAMLAWLAISVFTLSVSRRIG